MFEYYPPPALAQPRQPHHLCAAVCAIGAGDGVKDSIGFTSYVARVASAAGDADSALNRLNSGFATYVQ